MKVGLLGAGYIIDAHAKALGALPDVEVVAVCDKNLQRAEQAASRHGIGRVTGTLDELLSTGVESVHVLLPPPLHEQTARQIMEAGKHAFLEKPMGLSSQGCRELEKIAQAQGVKLAVNHNFLFTSAWEKLRIDVRSGNIGPIDSLVVNWFSPLNLLKTGPFDNWMLLSPENIVFELFPHLIAFAVDAVGPLEQIKAAAGRPIELPGGVISFRHWIVSACSGRTQIVMNLAVTSGAVNQSVLVRGAAATAYCDYDLDIYRRSEPSRHSLIIDDFLKTQQLGWQQILSSTRVLVRSIAGTLGKRTYASPYGYTFEKSIREFYRDISEHGDRRLFPEVGRYAIEACEAIVRSSGVSGTATNSMHQENALTNRAGPTVLVLGGTGFIGRHLIDQLDQRNIGVRLATRNANAARLLFSTKVVDVVEGDLRDPDFISKSLEGISTVFHLARCEGSKWEDYLKGEVEMTKTVATCCLAAGVKRLVYTGTIDSYYSADAKETITAITPLDPKIDARNFYARSKAMSEQILLQLYRDMGLPVVIFRPGIVIGRGGPAGHWGVARFWNDGAVDYWGSGRNKLPFVLVDDVVSALLKGMDLPGIEGRTFLITDEQMMNAREYVAELSKLLNMRIRSRPKAILKHYLGDLGKELLKQLIRHPNRRVPSFRDWSCRAQAARYDNTASRIELGWTPAESREALVERGIRPMAEEALR